MTAAKGVCEMTEEIIKDLRAQLEDRNQYVEKQRSELEQYKRLYALRGEALKTHVQNVVMSRYRSYRCRPTKRRVRHERTKRLRRGGELD